MNVNNLVIYKVHVAARAQKLPSHSTRSQSWQLVRCLQCWIASEKGKLNIQHRCRLAQFRLSLQSWVVGPAQNAFKKLEDISLDMKELISLVLQKKFSRNAWTRQIIQNLLESFSYLQSWIASGTDKPNVQNHCHLVPSPFRRISPNPGLSKYSPSLHILKTYPDIKESHAVTFKHNRLINR